jgi:protein-histidine pros-kinase
MRLQTRFNLVLLVVFVLGFAVSVLVTYRVLLQNAKEEVMRNAGLMMETALAVRAYTIDEIKPQLDPMLADRFLPQTVPAYSAVETFGRLQKKYPDFSYREATLNPTNPRDRTTPWEAEVVNRLRDQGEAELSGERETTSGRAIYIARPIKITNPACLACHSTPQAAPASLLARYGSDNGFGWQHNEIVGAQIVMVPTGLAEANALRAFWAFSWVLAGLFAVLFILINLMLSNLIVKPIRRIAEMSDEISKGKLDLPEFEETGADEIRHLHTAFNRMRRSIDKAMKVVQLQKSLIKPNKP